MEKPGRLKVLGCMVIKPIPVRFRNGTKELSQLSLQSSNSHCPEKLADMVRIYINCILDEVGVIHFSTALPVGLMEVRLI